MKQSLPQTFRNIILMFIPGCSYQSENVYFILTLFGPQKLYDLLQLLVSSLEVTDFCYLMYYYSLLPSYHKHPSS
jgi:hypothetical protein